MRIKSKPDKKIKGGLIAFLIIILIGFAIDGKAAPNLEITNVYLKQHAYKNKCRIWITIANKDGAISKGEFNKITLYLLKNNVNGVWGGYPLNVLDKNGILTHPKSSLSVPWNAILLSPGKSYKIGAKIGNNVYTPKTFVCGKTAASPYELRITSIYYDRDCRINVRVRNFGKKPLPNWVWSSHTPKSPGVYLYRNGQGWGGESIWKFDPKKHLRKPGGDAIYRSNLKINGKTRITAIVDYWNKIPESNKKNNKKTVLLICKPKKLPDLTIKNITLLKGCKIRVTIANIGKGELPNKAYNMHGGVSIQMYNNNKPWGGIVLGAVDTEKKLVKPGGTLSFEWFPMAKNLTLKPGNNKIKLTIDNKNTIKESNERNNTIIKTLNCGSTPDLGLYGFVKIGKNKRMVEWNRTITLTPSDAYLISNGKPAFNIYYAYREYNGVGASGFKNTIYFNSKVVSIQSNLSLKPKQIKYVFTQAYISPKNGALCFKIDSENNVSEKRENNNYGCVNVKFSGFSTSHTNTGSKYKKIKSSIPKAITVPRKKPNVVLPGDKVKNKAVVQ